MISLSSLGFDAQLLDRIAQDPDLSTARLGRVIEEQKGAYQVQTEDGVVWAVLAGRLQHAATTRRDLPAVGDFVQLEGSHAASTRREDRARLLRVLTRRTCLERKAAGETSDTQVIAANVDVVFVVTSLNQDLSERRLERYLVAIWDSGATPVVLLSKADLCDHADAAGPWTKTLALGVAVHAVSAKTGAGMEALAPYLQPGHTVALVGSSGVGKSSLLNAWLGDEVQQVQEIREADAKGRHTTTARSLRQLKNGGLVIDTPGMREFMPSSGDGTAMGAVFADVEALFSQCRFTDCQHSTEPGCAVQESLKVGTLSAERLQAYRKMQREQSWLARRTDKQAKSEQRKRWKQTAMVRRRSSKQR